MKLSHIKYGRRKIKIEYTLLKDCYGLYDPNTHILKIDKRQSGTKLFNTIMHELTAVWHEYALTIETLLGGCGFPHSKTVFLKRCGRNYNWNAP